jgi:hypothetical protein
LADRERAEDISGEDAAWRDLVARFDLPGDPDGMPPPWPEREDLLTARHRRPPRGAEVREGTEARDSAVGGETPESGSADISESGSSDRGSADRGSADPGSSDRGSSDRGSADRGSADPGTSDPGTSDRGGVDRGSDGSPDRDDDPAADNPGISESAVVDRTRVIKPAVPVQLPADDEDDHYIPPPPPPLPVLDPVAKGAWTALFGGPAYLLTATMTGWQMPGWATFGAVAAFVGGFAVIVMRMGDRPSGSGPDNGAVL